MPSLLLRLFFREFANWRWPTPVTLVPFADQPPPGVAPLPVWNPLNPRDGRHLMPIITPAYPSMNSSYNVGVPQLRRIQIELNQADQLMDEICGGNASFRDLFLGNDFFQRHMHFLQVNIIASNATDFLEWFRLCESRLRILIAGLESPECGIEVFPFAKFFERNYSTSTKSDENCKTESCFFMALRFAFGVENVDLRFCTSEFLHKVNSWEGRRLGMDLTIEHVLRKDLPSFLFESETRGIALTRFPKKAGKPPAVDPRPLSPALERKLKISDNDDPAMTGPSVPSPAKRPRTESTQEEGQQQI
jgi:poly(A) polymerase